MPAQAYWIEESQILGVSYSGRVNVDDVRRVIAVCVNALASGPVHFLVDFSNMSFFEPQILELSSLSEWLYHPNARWFAYVQVTGVYKHLLQVRHQSTTRFFQDCVEAEAFLRSTAGIPSEH